MHIYRSFMKFSTTHTKICILGGGSAGLNVSAKLVKHYYPQEIRIFEPSRIHYYQPAFTMIGGDLCSDKVAVRPMQQILPKNIPITPSSVKLVKPQLNQIITQQNQVFTYDQLIIGTGFKTQWQRIKGAEQALQDINCPVGSIYSYQYAQKTRKLGNSFKGGKAIFTEPQLPIKCAGAPQKILYLWTDKWQKSGIKAQINFFKNVDTMFGVPKYGQALAQIAKNYGINSNFKKRLIQVKKEQRIAVFLNLQNNQKQQHKFDFLHLVPPMVPHSYIKQSGLADQKGFCNVNKETLQHFKYQNIWSVGDCSSLPCSKTAAALFSQTQVLMKNFKQVVIKGNKNPIAKYDGYSCCPIFVGNNQLMLAQFKYDGVVSETFLKTQQKPRRLFYHLKKDFFPFAYWNFVPRGIWAGKDGFSTW